jgi:hypothetical protein
MVQKVKGGYQVVSSKGKNLGGPYKTPEEAKSAFAKWSFSNTEKFRTK